MSPVPAKLVWQLWSGRDNEAQCASPWQLSNLLDRVSYLSLKIKTSFSTASWLMNRSNAEETDISNRVRVNSEIGLQVEVAVIYDAVLPACFLVQSYYPLLRLNPSYDSFATRQRLPAPPLRRRQQAVQFSKFLPSCRDVS